MSKPIASVIIPTFNRERYLPIAIESVFNQIFKDYEIIVVDDGSTDNTQGVIEKYNKKIKYIYQNNAGVSSARNEGIRNAKGEWIAFLDSDDEWLPDYLLLQMERAISLPNVYTHITNSLEIAKDGGQVNSFERRNLLKIFKGNSFLIIGEPLQLVIKHHLSTLQSTVVKREIILKAGLFNSDLTIAEDIDMISRMALQGPLGLCNKPLAHICRRDEQIDHLAKQIFDNGIYSCKSFDKVYENLRNDGKLTDLEKRTLDWIRSRNKRAIANLLLKKREKNEAKFFFREAFLIYPSARSLFKYLISFLPVQIALLFVWKLKHVKP